jgi:hypothetical protein
MRRGVCSTIVGLGALAASLPSASSPALGGPMLHSRAGEFQPVRSGRYLAWERNTRARPGRYAVYARRAGGRKFRVNARGTEAANGGIDGTRLVYQQFRKKKSDIKFFDVARRRRRNPPKGINTRHWEYWPSISGDWVMFGRYARRGNRKVVLTNLRTGAARVIARTTATGAFLGPGQVSGVWAVYTECTPATRCDVLRYNIVTRKTSRVPNPGFYQRAPSVTPSGTVYFARARHRCGQSVRVMRHALGSRPTTVRRLPDGVDVGDTYVFARGPGGNRVLFDRRRCGKPAGSNIHQLAQPRLLALGARIEGAGGGLVASRPRGIRCGRDCLHSFKAGTSVTLTARPETNANFTGWGGACSGPRASCTTTVARAASVIAFFDPASSFSLSVTKTGSGIVTSAPRGIRCGADCWEAYRAGTPVRLTASPAAGWRFARWSGACGGTGTCTVIVDRVRAVRTTFVRTASTSALRSGRGRPAAGGRLAPAVVHPSYAPGHGAGPSTG